MSYYEIVKSLEINNDWKSIDHNKISEEKEEYKTIFNRLPEESFLRSSVERGIATTAYAQERRFDTERGYRLIKSSNILYSYRSSYYPPNYFCLSEDSLLPAIIDVLMETYNTESIVDLNNKLSGVNQVQILSSIIEDLLFSGDYYGIFLPNISDQDILKKHINIHNFKIVKEEIKESVRLFLGGDFSSDHLGIVLQSTKNSKVKIKSRTYCYGGWYLFLNEDHLKIGLRGIEEKIKRRLIGNIDFHYYVLQQGKKTLNSERGLLRMLRMNKNEASLQDLIYGRFKV